MQGFGGLRLGVWISSSRGLRAAAAALLASSLACGGEDSTVVVDVGDGSPSDGAPNDGAASDGVTSEGDPAGLEPGLKILGLSLPSKSKQTALITGTPADAAAELVRRLRDEARAL